MRRRFILVEAAAAIAVSRIALFALPFSIVARRAGVPGAPAELAGEAAHQLRARAVARAIRRVARFLRLRDTCLTEGLAAQWMLQRRGIPAVLRFGVSRSNGRLIAHAWVIAAGMDVVGGGSAPDYVPIADLTSR